MLAALIALSGCAQAEGSEPPPVNPNPSATLCLEPPDREPSPPPEGLHRFGCGLLVWTPSGWAAEPDDPGAGRETLWLRSSETVIGVEVYPRFINDRKLGDPRTWSPNEGGYEAHWLQEIEVNGLSGLLFVWGMVQEGAWDLAPSLMATFYDPERELDIHMFTDFTSAGLLPGADLDLEQVIANQFVEFNIVLESLQFESPPGVSMYYGVLRTGAELGESKSYCTEGYYLVGDLGTLLLRTDEGRDVPSLFADARFLGKAITVTGLYPAQEFFCEALLCECEPYILVESVALAP
jgi:hypothetical protein